MKTRGCNSAGRGEVSKTSGRGFESRRSLKLLTY